MEDEEKRQENMTDKPRVVLKKGPWGENHEETISRIAGNPFSVSEIIPPLLKNPRISGKAALVVIISKQHNGHKQKKENQPKKQK